LIYWSTGNWQQSAGHTWADGAGSSGWANVEQQTDGSAGPNDYTSDVSYSWPASFWPEMKNGTRTEVIDGGTPVTTEVGPPGISGEHCDIKAMGTYDYSGPLITGTGFGTTHAYQDYSRKADTETKLFTGGKSTSQQQTVWELTGAVTEIRDQIPPQLPLLILASTNVPVAPERVSLGQFGNQDTNALLYAQAPQGATVDITARTEGLSHYSRSSSGTDIHLTGLTVVSNATQVSGTNWAAVKATNGYVFIEATLNQNTTNAAKLIKWTGGEAVEGNPFQRKVTKAESAKTLVTASMGTNTLGLNVWIAWASFTKFNNTGPKDSDSDVEPPYFGTTDTLANGTLMQVTITPSGFGVFTNVGYDIKRTLEWGVWYLDSIFGWQQAVHHGPGDNDDNTNTDEDLTPSAQDHIYSADWPGFTLSTAGADEGVMKASFVEWVTINLSGWERCSTDYLWHSIVWLEKDGVYWKRKTSAPNEIETGSITVGTNQTP
jgi:hypothetical protein